MIKTEGELSGWRMLAGAAGIIALLATPIVLSKTGSVRAEPALKKAATNEAPKLDQTTPYTFKGSTKGCKDWKYVGKPDNCEVFEYPTVVYVIVVDKKMKCVYRKNETGCRWVDANLLVPLSETHYSGSPN